MNKPPFVMSKYASKTDLYKAKAEFYEKECERLQRILDHRPAINDGLVEKYIEWSQGIYLCDVVQGLDLNN